MVKNLNNTFYDSKRLLSFEFNNPNVQKNMLTWPFTLVEGR